MAGAKMSEFRTSLIGAFLVALGPISMALYTPAMPQLVKAFGTTDSAIKLSLSLYFAGYALAQLVSGTVSDALGRRKTTMIFMGIYLIGSVLAAFAPSVNILLIGRLIQGIGSSVGMTVSRALVRDQFTGHTAAKIMNMIAIMLAIGPAIAPTIGGFSLTLFGWQSVFFLMVGFAIIACLVAYFLMVETIDSDLGRLQPGPVISAYKELLSDNRFVSAIFVVGGAVGALYTQATILPFVLIDKVGLTPTQFGVGMLMQSGFFLTGSLVVQQLLKRFQAAKLVIPGLVLVAIAQHFSGFVDPDFTLELFVRNGTSRYLRFWNCVYPAVHDDSRHGTLPAYCRFGRCSYGFRADGVRCCRRFYRGYDRHSGPDRWEPLSRDLARSASYPIFCIGRQWIAIH